MDEIVDVPLSQHEMTIVATGEMVTVHVFQQMIQLKTRGGIRRKPGHKFMETDNGETVQHAVPGQPGRYYILRGIRKIELTCSDPDAP